MKETNRIKILEQENKELRLEIESLKRTLELYLGDTKEDILNDLNALKNEKENELSEYRLYKEQYEKLLRDICLEKNKFENEMQRYLSAIKKI